MLEEVDRRRVRKLVLNVSSQRVCRCCMLNAPVHILVKAHCYMQWGSGGSGHAHFTQDRDMDSSGLDHYRLWRTRGFGFSSFYYLGDFEDEMTCLRADVVWIVFIDIYSHLQQSLLSSSLLSFLYFVQWCMTCLLFVIKKIQMSKLIEGPNTCLLPYF